MFRFWEVEMQKLILYMKSYEYPISLKICLQKWQKLEFYMLFQSNQCSFLPLYVPYYTFKIDFLKYIRHPVFFCLQVQRQSLFNSLFSMDTLTSMAFVFSKRLARFVKRRINLDTRCIFSYKNVFLAKSIKWFHLVLISKKFIIYNDCYETISWIKVFILVHFIIFFFPTVNIIQRLKLQNCCNVEGYPIAKINWIFFKDIQILNQFQALYNKYYYSLSGIVKKNTLNYVFNILYYTCLKTLACKRKKNIRKIAKDYHTQHKTILSQKWSYYNFDIFFCQNHYH
jgi:hypothetical protein